MCSVDTILIQQNHKYGSYQSVLTVSESSAMHYANKNHKPIELLCKKCTHHKLPIISCLSYLSCYYDKIPGKSNLPQKGFILAHRSRKQSPMVGKPRWQDVEAAAYITSPPVKRQRLMNEGCC